MEARGKEIVLEARPNQRSSQIQRRKGVRLNCLTSELNLDDNYEIIQPDTCSSLFSSLV